MRRARKKSAIGLGTTFALIAGVVGLPAAAGADGIEIVPTLSIASAVTVKEGTNPAGSKVVTNASFNVTLSNKSSEDVTFKVHTENGTATAPADYRSKTNASTFTIKAGKKSGVVTVQVVRDAAPEPDETFRVVIDQTSAQLGNTTGVGTITDDDTPPPPPADPQGGTLGSTAPVGDVDQSSLGTNETKGSLYVTAYEGTLAEHAMPVSITRSGLLTGVGVASTFRGGGIDSPFTVQLTRHTTDGPGEVVRTATVTAQSLPFGGSSQVTYLVFNEPLQVAAGDQYDLVEKVRASSDSYCVVSWLTPDKPAQASRAPYYSFDGGSTWSVSPYQVAQYQTFIKS